MRKPNESSLGTIFKDKDSSWITYIMDSDAPSSSIWMLLKAGRSDQ